jgi:hypothetical protein
MERHCNTLLQAISSRRHPYSSISSFVAATAQLDQIRLLYDLHEALRLDPDKKNIGKLIHDLCMSIFFTGCLALILTDPAYTLSPSRRHEILTQAIKNKVFACLATRFDVRKSVIQSVVKLDRPVTQYGRILREGGDLMRGHHLVKEAEDGRDASFIRVESFPSFMYTVLTILFSSTLNL